MMAVKSSKNKVNLYNPILKERFLEMQDESTSYVYRHTFMKSFEMEEYYKKDLCEFNLDQIRYTMYKINPSTLAASGGQLSVIKSYITFCIEQGFTKSNINILEKIPRQWYFQFVDQDSKIYYTNDEINHITKHLENAQDAVIVRLLFEGVNGYQASEIGNLKIEDLIEREDSYLLKLHCDKKGERSITPSEDLIRLIKQANKETEYAKRNGNSESKSKYADLIENGHVLKPAKIGRKREEEDNELNKIDKHNIYRRISMIKDVFDLYSLTPKNIERSGMLNEMRLILKDERRELEKEEMEQILQKFGVTKVITGGSLRYNNTYYKEILNLKNLEHVYFQGEVV